MIGAKIPFWRYESTDDQGDALEVSAEALSPADL